MPNKKSDEFRIEMLGIAAIAACNEFIESNFKRVEDYDDLHWETKIRIIKVLKANWKMDDRIQA